MPLYFLLESEKDPLQLAITRINYLLEDSNAESMILDITNCMLLCGRLVKRVSKLYAQTELALIIPRLFRNIAFLTINIIINYPACIDIILTSIII